MRRYVLLPAEGIEDETLNIEALNVEDRPLTLDQVGRAIELAAQGNYIGAAAKAVEFVIERITAAGLERTGQRPAFTVEHSYGESGPKIIRAYPSTERLLRASGYRLVPVTYYRPQEIALGATDTEPDFRPCFLQSHIVERLRPEDGPLGRGVVVGVIDTGVDRTHPQLVDAIAGGRGLSHEDITDFGPCPQKMGDHGTHVAGIVAARAAGGMPRGVAPEAVIRPYRVFRRTGPLRAENGDIIDAVRMAIDDGCHILNFSIGGSRAREDGVRDAIRFARNAGVLCVAAAGNHNRRTVTFPAAHPHCVAVSAVGRDGTFPPGRAVSATPRAGTDPDIFLADFTNIGPRIAATAPGVYVDSTVPGGARGRKSGTSMAAPVIAGFAAVLLSRHPALIDPSSGVNRADALYQILVANCRRLELGSYDYEGYGFPLV